MKAIAITTALCLGLMLVILRRQGADSLEEVFFPKYKRPGPDFHFGDFRDQVTARGSERWKHMDPLPAWQTLLREATVSSSAAATAISCVAPTLPLPRETASRETREKPALASRFADKDALIRALDYTPTGHALLSLVKSPSSLQVEIFRSNGAQSTIPGEPGRYGAETHTVYLNLAEETGRLIPALAHELAHAVFLAEYAAWQRREDNVRWDVLHSVESLIRKTCWKKNKDRRELKPEDFGGADVTELLRQKQLADSVGDIFLFQQERLAADIEWQVRSELASEFPDYYATVAKGAQNKTDETIVANYELNPSTIEHYRNGTCEPL